MYKQKATFMDRYFSKFQCGFRKSYSTQQCLIALIEKWKSAVDSGKSFGALFVFLNLNAYGFSLSALKFICSYLFNRQQITKINASYSS